MFKRLIYDDWQSLIPILAFASTFLVFAYFVVRAFLIKRPELHRMAHLPLDADNPESDSHLEPS